MTKLTLTLVGEDDHDARNLLSHVACLIATHLATGDPLTTGPNAYSVSFDYGNASCDVARFTPVCGSEEEVNRLAAAFTDHVRAFFLDDGELDDNDYFQELLTRNRTEPNPSICHTHDFCDANILMSNAWEETFPHEPLTPQNTFHAELWTAAWQQAKAAEFSPSPNLPVSSSSDSPAA